MIVACDTFDHGDFPHYVMPGQNAREVAKQYDNEAKMLRLMEVYDLATGSRSAGEFRWASVQLRRRGDEDLEALPKTDDLVPILRALRRRRPPTTREHSTILSTVLPSSTSPRVRGRSLGT